MAGNYCLAVSLPPNVHHTADWALASMLISGPIITASFVNSINPYLAFVGGILGCCIAAIRLYRMVRGKKDDDV